MPLVSSSYVRRRPLYLLGLLAAAACSSGSEVPTFENQGGADSQCKGVGGCRAGEGGAPSHIDPLGGHPDAGGGSACIDAKVPFTPQIPTVVFLVDKSGSMNDDRNFGQAVQQAIAAGTYQPWDCIDTAFDDNQDTDEYWRWNVVRNLLLNPTSGVVKKLENEVRFGFVSYTSVGGFLSLETPKAYDFTRTCPILEEVSAAVGTYDEILAKFKCSDIGADTPTGESLRKAADSLTAVQEPGPKVIVLATDGGPDDCMCPGFTPEPYIPDACTLPGVEAQVQEDVIATAEQIKNEGMTVHVIDVSSPTQPGLSAHLTKVAAAGGGQLFSGFDPGQLKEAFDSAINGARSCTIDLGGKIMNGQESKGSVKLDGSSLPFGDPDGWHVLGASQIELTGAACTTLKDGEHELSITFPCNTFQVN